MVTRSTQSRSVFHCTKSAQYAFTPQWSILLLFLFGICVTNPQAQACLCREGLHPMKGSYFWCEMECSYSWYESGVGFWFPCLQCHTHGSASVALRPILGWGREVGTDNTVGFLHSLSSLIETRHRGSRKRRRNSEGEVGSWQQ